MRGSTCVRGNAVWAVSVKPDLSGATWELKHMQLA